MDITVRSWCNSNPNNLASWCNGNTGDFGSLVPGSNPGEATNLKCSLNNILWGSLMVRCQAHNLETVIASVSSILTPATKKETYSKLVFNTLFWLKEKENLSPEIIM